MTTGKLHGTRPNDAGKAAYFCGEVFQVLEDGDTVNLMVNVTDSEWGWEDAVFVNYTRQSYDEPRVLEEDIVEIWGRPGRAVYL